MYQPRTYRNWVKNKEGNLEYVVFDLLYLDGVNLTRKPLRDRKNLLARVLPKLPHVTPGEHIEERGTAFFASAKKQGLEGVIAKDASSPYVPGQRTNYWQKIKSHLRQEFVIGGFTKPRRTRTKFGALVLGLYSRGKLVYVGHTGTGFDEQSLDLVAAKLKPLIQKDCPFATEPETNEPATWVAPKLVCEVSFAQWTGDNQLRQAIFMGLRPDKNPKDVRKE